MHNGVLRFDFSKFGILPFYCLFELAVVTPLVVLGVFAELLKLAEYCFAIHYHKFIWRPEIRNSESDFNRLQLLQSIKRATTNFETGPKCLPKFN